MYPSKQQVIQWIEKLAPKDWAEDWDNVGLQIGSVDGTARAVYFTLTVGEESVQEACRLGCSMIVSHHPFFFRPVKRLDTSDSSGASGRIVKECLRNDITVYSCHTNLDVAPGGINDALMKCIRIPAVADGETSEPLKKTGEVPFYKLAVCVPESHLDQVRKVLASEGAGKLRNYSDCAFWVKGTGTFLPEDGSEPHIGSVGVREQVGEVKIEVVVRGDRLNSAVRAMLKAHPYEVPAYDVYRIENLAKAYGLGRMGVLDTPVALSQLAEDVKCALGAASIRIIGDLRREVKKVAVCGGAGGEVVSCAARRADVLITGDIRYHEALTALELGLCIIDAGHYETEKPGVNMLADYVKDKALSGKFELDVHVESNGAGPFLSA